MFLPNYSLTSLFDSSYKTQPKIFPELTTATVIGISVAITGNVVISLALNLQKLAHKRLDSEMQPTSPSDGLKTSNADSERRRVSIVDEEREFMDSTSLVGAGNSRVVESEPLLLPFPRGPQSSSDYGSSSSSSRPRKPLSRIFAFKSRSNPRAKVLPIDVVSGSTIRARSKPRNSQEGPSDEVECGNESNYLKSKLWWSGFLLMNIGEMGNFISYAWAPASVVAPLGTFALVANCLFSPLILGERFRKRDIFGILIAIIGAITVVLSSNASDSRLNPDGLVRAISQTPFIVYTCIYAVGAIILASLSRSSYGRRYALIDVGLCALFGGFTVLSTKAVSTLLTMQWSEVFTSLITYPVILVLVLTGVGQIRYLNRALQRFDSKIVIPIQFVLFTLSAILGSAILYGDFKRANFHQFVTFLYGCAATFAGVFIIAWSSQDSEEESENHEDGQPNNGVEGAAAVRAEQVASNLSLGSLARKRKATLVLPDDIGDIPALQHKHSAIGIMGFSPAQPLLLVHTPPRDYTMRDFERDPPTPSSHQRQRAASWVGDDSSPRGQVYDGGKRTRESSLTGRLRSSTGASGVSQATSSIFSNR